MGRRKYFIVVKWRTFLKVWMIVEPVHVKLGKQQTRNWENRERQSGLQSNTRILFVSEFIFLDF